jgi:hypothetical protein
VPFSISLQAPMSSPLQVPHSGLSAIRSSCVSFAALIFKVFYSYWCVLFQPYTEKCVHCLPLQPACSGLCTTRTRLIRFATFLLNAIIYTWIGTRVMGRSYVPLHVSLPAVDTSFLIYTSYIGHAHSLFRDLGSPSTTVGSPKTTSGSSCECSLLLFTLSC